MSTPGSPGGRQVFGKPSPPERGSFPLDHDGECTAHMARYLACIKRARGVNVDDCRILSREYLQCRMDRNLMAQDEMKNLGFAKGMGTEAEKELAQKELAQKEKERDKEET